MIREDNVTLETLSEDLAREHITLKEYVTRSEGTAIITTVLNKVLMDKYKAYPAAWRRIFKVIQSDGRDVRVPDINAINPAYVPELSEIPFANMDITSTTIEVDKYGMRAGISQEMIDDNEVNLLGWTVGMLGTKMSELQDEEGIKAIHTYNITSANLDASVAQYKGRYNRGAFHLTGALPLSGISATAMGWEEALSTGLNRLRDQTITLLGETYRYPVYANSILIHTSKALTLAKVLNATLTVVATGVADVIGVAGGKTQLAGTNVFKNLVNMIETPYAPTRTSWLFDSNRGSLVMVTRKAPVLDKTQNFAFDAQEVRGLTRFRAAVTEARGIIAIKD